MTQFISIFVSTISISIVFLFGCIGEIVMEKGGHLNLGVPGVMCLGTLGGSFGTSLVMSMYASDPNSANYFLLILGVFLGAVIFSLLGGFIYAILTVTLKCNQNVTGLALTTFGAGMVDFFMSKIDKTYLSNASDIIKTPLPFAKNLGVFGELFLNYGLFTYLAIIIAIIAAIVLNHTRVGLSLRAVGENPATADAVGINVSKYKYGAILIGSSIAGLGGMYYLLAYGRGTWENSSTVQVFGWLAIALVIFTVWKPGFAILGSIIFGFLFILPNIVSGIDFVSMKLLNLVAYVVTVLVLIITSIVGKKSVQPPSGLGQSYFREDR